MAARHLVEASYVGLAGQVHEYVTAFSWVCRPADLSASCPVLSA